MTTLNLCLIVLIGVYAVFAGIGLHYVFEHPRNPLSWCITLLAVPCLVALLVVLNHPVLS
jgi:hypothetical protein